MGGSANAKERWGPFNQCTPSIHTYNKTHQKPRAYRHVLGRAAHGGGALVRPRDAALGEAEVPQADVARGVQQDVLGLGCLVLFFGLGG